MIILCSLKDVKKYARGTIYRTSIGGRYSMDAYKGIACLYPSWPMVMGHKNHTVSDESYCEQYEALMQQRWPAVEAWLKGLRTDTDITLLCYCPEFENGEHKFCHRMLIAKIIEVCRPDLKRVIVRH